MKSPQGSAVPRPAVAGGHGLPVAAVREGWRLREIVLLLPKILLTMLVVLAVGDMIVGVFLRYVLVPITDYFNLEPIRFFWVEEMGEFSLAWLTLVGAGIGLAERSHFTLHLLTHHLPLRVQQVIHVVNHVIIVAFGALTAWYGAGLAETNSTLISPGLQISLGWLYGSAAVGGVLIVLYGAATGFTEFAEIGKAADEKLGAITAAGD